MPPLFVVKPEKGDGALEQPEKSNPANQDKASMGRGDAFEIMYNVFHRPKLGILDDTVRTQLQLHILLHFFHDIEGSRADTEVLHGNGTDLVKLFPVGMRIFPAGFRTHIINRAIVVCSQESTGYFLKHIIPVLIDPEVLANKFLRP